jgi:hypothetical protein
MHGDKPAKYGVGVNLKEIPFIMRTGYPEREDLHVDEPIGELFWGRSM